jgi:hypothetical protein
MMMLLLLLLRNDDDEEEMIRNCGASFSFSRCLILWYSGMMGRTVLPIKH